MCNDMRWEKVVPQYRSVLFYVLGWSMMLVWWTGSAQFFGLMSWRVWWYGRVVWSNFFSSWLVGLDLRNGRKAVDEDGLFFSLDCQEVDMAFFFVS